MQYVQQIHTHPLLKGRCVSYLTADKQTFTLELAIQLMKCKYHCNHKYFLHQLSPCRRTRCAWQTQNRKGHPTYKQSTKTNLNMGDKCSVKRVADTLSLRPTIRICAHAKRAGHTLARPERRALHVLRTIPDDRVGERQCRILSRQPISHPC